MLMQAFICFILLGTKTQSLAAEASNFLAENNDEYDVLVKTALFEKLNFLAKELQKITQQFSDFKKRQLNQYQIVRHNAEAFKTEIRQHLEQHEVKAENLVAAVQEGIVNSFNEQKKFLKNSLLNAENLQSYENVKFKRIRNWQTILRRQDGSLSFNRSWLDYKSGFGQVNGNYFIGLEALHAITRYSDPQELLIILQDFDNRTRYAKYSDFAIGSESEQYKIVKLGSYQGDAGDSFTEHYNAKFSTYDHDNDNTTVTHCAKRYQGGWWFSNCFSSHLTGVYLYQPAIGQEKDKGLIWYSWHGLKFSLKYVEMLIRPK